MCWDIVLLVGTLQSGVGCSGWYADVWAGLRAVRIVGKSHRFEAAVFKSES